MKHTRTDKEYGGGTGKTVFEGHLFKVTIWTLSGGVRTTITSEFMHWLEVDFDGEIMLSSDEDCIEQLEPKELIVFISEIKSHAFVRGENSKIQSIKKCFELSS